MYLEFSYHWQIAQLTGFFTFVYTHFILLRQQENLKCVYLIKKQGKGQKRSWGKKNKQKTRGKKIPQWTGFIDLNVTKVLGEVSPHLHINSWREKTSLLITGTAPGNSPHMGKGKQQGCWGSEFPAEFLYACCLPWLTSLVRRKGQKTRLEEGLTDKVTGKCSKECQWTGEERWDSNSDQQAQAEGEIRKDKTFQELAAVSGIAF